MLSFSRMTEISARATLDYDSSGVVSLASLLRIHSAFLLFMYIRWIVLGLTHFVLRRAMFC